jgi:hypothetical protein
VAEEYRNILLATGNANSDSGFIFFDPKPVGFMHPHQKNSRIMLATVERNPENKRFETT